MSKKYTQSDSEEDHDKIVGQEDTSSIFRQSQPKEDSMVEKGILTFKQNRAFELHVGRDIYRFEGRESKEVPRSILKHKDFT